MELCQLLDNCNYDPGADKLVFVGDIINKGPYSKECYELVNSCPNAVVISGNHERGFSKAVEQGDLFHYKSFVNMSQEWSKHLLKEISTWAGNLPFYYQTREFLVVHAGFDPRMGFRNASNKELCEIRTIEHQGERIPWHQLYRGKRIVFYGHWGTQGLCLRENSIGLDSGCVYGGYLSAYIWPQKKLVQVKAQKVYKPVVRI